MSAGNYGAIEYARGDGPTPDERKAVADEKLRASLSTLLENTDDEDVVETLLSWMKENDYQVRRYIEDRAW